MEICDICNKKIGLMQSSTLMGKTLIHTFCIERYEADPAKYGGKEKKELTPSEVETWKKVDLYLDGKSKKLDIDEITVNTKTSTFIIKKLIKEEKEKLSIHEEKDYVNE